MRKRHPARLIVAVPVGSRSAVDALGPTVDEVVCLEVRTRFQAVGLYYEDFRPTSDAEVETLLRQFQGYSPA
jgi:predicted phosphoribosyltransferase